MASRFSSSASPPSASPRSGSANTSELFGPSISITAALPSPSTVVDIHQQMQMQDKSPH